jgi:hypothetical protein
MISYEVKEAMGLISIIKTDEEGNVFYIPCDPANSDYQAYLNKDKAEQSTPSLTDEATTK